MAAEPRYRSQIGPGIARTQSSDDARAERLRLPGGMLGAASRMRAGRVRSQDHGAVATGVGVPGARGPTGASVTRNRPAWSSGRSLALASDSHSAHGPHRGAHVPGAYIIQDNMPALSGRWCRGRTAMPQRHNVRIVHWPSARSRSGRIRLVASTSTHASDVVAAKGNTCCTLGHRLQLGGRLNAGEPAAGYHERQRPPPLLRVLDRRGVVELSQHVVAQVYRLGQGLEANRVLGQARDGQRPGHRTGGQHQDVVAQRVCGAVPRLEVGPPGIVVDAGDPP